MNYRDHSNKLTILKPLKIKRAEGISLNLIDICTTFGGHSPLMQWLLVCKLCSYQPKRIVNNIEIMLGKSRHSYRLKGQLLDGQIRTSKKY